MASVKNIRNKKSEFENRNSLNLRAIATGSGSKVNPSTPAPTFKLVKEGLATVVSAENLPPIDWDSLLEDDPGRVWD